MRRIWILTILAVCGIQVGVSPTLHAQAGPEIRRLDAFVGQWRLDIDIKATPTTQAIKASGTEACTLFANMHVVCTADAGTYRAMRTISYLPALKQYGTYSVDSYGIAVYALGQVNRDTWTFSTEAGGYKARTVINLSRDNYTSTYEYAGADGKWVPASVTRGTKTR